MSHGSVKHERTADVVVYVLDKYRPIAAGGTKSCKGVRDNMVGHQSAPDIDADLHIKSTLTIT